VCVSELASCTVAAPLLGKRQERPRRFSALPIWHGTQMPSLAADRVRAETAGPSAGSDMMLCDVSAPYCHPACRMAAAADGLQR
jgi:hypothetical protein